MRGKVFIKESHLSEAPSFCKRSLSAFFNPAEEYLFDYFDFSSFKDFYDYIFCRLNQRLADNKSPEFYYKGVNLLACFKHDLFDYLYLGSAYLSALINFMRSNPQDDIYFYKSGKDDAIPYLYQAIEACKPNIITRAHSMQPPAVRSGPGRINMPSSDMLKTFLWPKEISMIYNKPRIVLFSDYRRIKCFVPDLRHSAVFFTDSKSPKTFALSFKNRLSYVQISRPSTYRKCYTKIAHDMMRHAQKTGIFDGIEAEDYNLSAILRSKFGQLCTEYMPGLLYQIDKTYDFFEKNPYIEAVLLDEDITPVKNAFCQITQKLDIYSCVECHGGLNEASGFVPLTADKIFAWGKEQKGTLVKWGCPPEKIVVSGCSRYHQYQKMQDAFVKKQVFYRLGFDAKIRTVLFAPREINNERHFSNKIIFERNRDILDVILKYPDIQLVVKLHQGERNCGYYETRCRQSDVRCRVKILKEFDPYLLIKSSDFIIVHDSTMAIDGFALRRNVIFFPLTDDRSRFTNNGMSDFNRYRVFYDPKSLTEFKRIFDLLLENSTLPPPMARIEEARRNCLNEGDSLPMDAIKGCLLNFRTDG